ncbi:MAG: carboxymuconolactone decarboxylase family protein [Sphingobium sp.]
MNRSAVVEMEDFEALLSRTAMADGEPLSALDRALIQTGLAASLPCLDQGAIQTGIGRALAQGATPAQIQEVISVVAGLGVHSLMASATTLIEASRQAGFDLEGPLSEEEARLWDKRVGTDPFWDAMETELPGFLKAMLRLSPAQFEAFFDFCAVPWKTRAVPARVKELLALASDAMAAHRFLPGFRLHLANAIQLGAGRIMVRECLQLAAEAPPHRGIA